MGEIFVLSILLFGSFATADEVLVISGGGSPVGNHYSQYLQTKTLTDELRTMLPNTGVSVFFGAGNSTNASPVLADVHKILRENQNIREVMIPGFINENTSATKQNIEAYFNSSKPSSIKPEETFFLIVSDHGMPYQYEDGLSDPTFSNNCIDLWGFNADLTTGQTGDSSATQRCLSKNQLKTYLTNNVSAKRTVFAMSQCFSGGFHQMAVESSSGYPTANAKICGFTAITEDTTASGCTPDVDGPGYQGYERSFTQQLTGIDVVTGKRLRTARKSFVEAHREATLEDRAKDIPLATSDYFLWKWALKIEENSFFPRTQLISTEESRNVLTQTVLGAKNVKHAGYQSKEAFFLLMQKEFLSLYPQDSKSLAGSLQDIQDLENKVLFELAQIEQQLNNVGTFAENGILQITHLWNQHVATGKSTLSVEETELELGFFGAYDTKYGPGSAGSMALYLMSLKSITEPEAALAISTYKANRSKYALNWALNPSNVLLKMLSEQIKAADEQSNILEEKYNNLTAKHGHVRRLLIYRKVLGAWNALSKMKDSQALKELTDLIACESTALPNN